jgi:cell division protein ZapA
MAGRAVQVRVGGQTYRVVTTASDEELKHLAKMVDDKLAAVVPAGRAVSPQAMLLAAMALAHDLEEERARSASIANRARGVYGRMIQRVEAALGAVGGTNGATPDEAWTPVALAGAPNPGAPANES